MRRRRVVHVAIVFLAVGIALVSMFQPMLGAKTHVVPLALGACLFLAGAVMLIGAASTRRSRRA